MAWLQKLRSAVEEFGPGPAAVYLTHRTLSRIGGAAHLYHFVAQPVGTQPRLGGARGRSIETRLVEGDDPALSRMPLDRKVIAYRLSQGARCLGAFKNGAMIGCLWLCLDGYVEDEVRCRFRPLPPGRTAWDFDVFLLPEHRVGLGFLRLWDTADAYLRERGVGWSISRISALNHRSLSVHGALGAKHLGKAFFLRFGPAQLMIATLPPYLHFSFAPGAIPELLLKAPQEVAGNSETPGPA